MPRELYHLSEGDREIFKLTPKDPNYFTDYYLRGDMTGTWWRDITGMSSDIVELQEIIDRWIKGYEIIHAKWVKLGRPDQFDHGERHYFTFYEDSIDNPAFHDHHGFIFLPWQKEWFYAQQMTKIALGGYGSAKSVGELVCNLIRMATKYYYKALVIAPFSYQAMQVYNDARILLTGTEYEKRFVRGSFKMKPVPTITVRNDLCVESTMEFYSLDHPEKLLNLSCDSFHVEQCEQVDDLDWLFEIMGSRLRGQVGGRERLGLISLVANSDEAGNPILWDYMDEAKTDLDGIYAVQPWTIHNTYISPRQLKELIKRMPKDPKGRDRALKGARPIGSGEHFSQDSIEKCHNTTLDDIMLAGLRSDDNRYRYNVQPKAQVVQWELPPEPDHEYLLVADPGWSNPPLRNSPVLMVFDITHFPVIPANMRAFAWVYGNNSPDPWIAKYIEFCNTYGCKLHNAFDSTGQQSGYEHLVHGLSDLNPWTVKLGGDNKFTYLNAAKTLVSRGKYGFPDIPMLFSQLAKYKLPDLKIRQDIVSCLIVASAYLNWMFFGAEDQSVVTEPKEEDGRYKYHSRNRTHTR